MPVRDHLTKGLADESTYPSRCRNRASRVPPPRRPQPGRAEPPRRSAAVPHHMLTCRAPRRVPPKTSKYYTRRSVPARYGARRGYATGGQRIGTHVAGAAARSASHAGQGGKTIASHGWLCFRFRWCRCRRAEMLSAAIAYRIG